MDMSELKAFESTPVTATELLRITNELLEHNFKALCGVAALQAGKSFFVQIQSRPAPKKWKELTINEIAPPPQLLPNTFWVDEAAPISGPALAELEKWVNSQQAMMQADFEALFKGAIIYGGAVGGGKTHAWGVGPGREREHIDPAVERATLLELADLLEWEPSPTDAEPRYVQVKGRLHFDTTLESNPYCKREVHRVCAMGKVLMMKGVDVRELEAASASIDACFDAARTYFSGLRREVVDRIVRMNDADGASFRSIARMLRRHAAAL